MTDTASVDMPLSFVAMAGDGIGPEISQAAARVLTTVLDALGVAHRCQDVAIGFAALEASGSTFPEAAFEAAQAADGILLGPVSHNDYPPVAEGGRNPSGDLRRRLALYANVRPARSVEGLATPTGRAMDLVFVRENTEGFYADRTMFAGTGEIMPTPDLAMSFRKVTREGSIRIAEHAFELAAKRRGRVTAVHKANVLRTSDGFFLSCVREVAARYPDIEYEEQLVDAMAALLIRDPSVFDVVVTTNMFGDILSDEATELAGGIGLAASLNAGRDHAVAQAQHGSAPTLAGQDKANPCSLVGSVAMLLRWLGERRHDARLARGADAIETALRALVAAPATRTVDLGGTLGTAAFTDALIARIEKTLG